jgi:hypothetical protein
MRAAGSERFGFVDEHDGYPIFHGIHEPARVTHQHFRGGTILELPLALGADQNLEKLRGETHANSLGPRCLSR